jgi:hypothetical protein
VESVTLPTADFLRHAAALFAAAPVRDVRLSDRRPQNYHNNGEGRLFGWHRGHRAGAERDEPFDLSPELWALVVDDDHCIRNGPWADFRSPGAAFAALSDACVAYGRGEAARECCPPFAPWSDDCGPQEPHTVVVTFTPAP